MLGAVDTQRFELVLDGKGGHVVAEQAHRHEPREHARGVGWRRVVGGHDGPVELEPQAVGVADEFELALVVDVDVLLRTGHRLLRAEAGGEQEVARRPQVPSVEEDVEVEERA